MNEFLGGDMDKSEGIAFPPVPVAAGRRGAATLRGPMLVRDNLDLPCEMCGTPVVAYHCKRICLRCGFMTGCSEGI
jgi:hypothetical protein